MKLQEYDEAFFEKKDLIIYEMKGNPYGYFRYELVNIKYSENNVFLVLREKEKKGVRFEIYYTGKHLIVIEIDKRDDYENKNLEVTIKKSRSFKN